MKYIELTAVAIAVVLLCGALVVGYERSGDAPTPVARPAQEPHAIPSAPALQHDASTAMRAPTQPSAPRAGQRHPRPEEVLRLPWQIQGQVAATVLTPAPLLGPAEILTLPWYIQNQVWQAQRSATR